MGALVRRLDRLQRRWKATAFIWAVQKKFGEDRGGYLCALITYYGLLSIFPLLLAAFTIVAYVLAGNHSATATLVHHIGQYPIIGPAASDLAGAKLHGSPVALIIGLLGLIWGAQGLAQAVLFSSQQAWYVPRNDQPGFLPRLLTGLAWYGVFGIGALASTFISSLGSLLNWSGGTVLSTLLVIVFDVGLFWVSYHLLAPKGAPWRRSLPGAIVAGILWAVLTGVGVGLAHSLAHTNALYGTFAPVLGLLAFIYLMARISLLALEINVVIFEGLWPRSLTNDDLTDADRKAAELMLRRDAESPPLPAESIEAVEATE